jgi:hypothetical protein
VKDFFGDNRVVRRFKNFFFLLQKRSGLREKVYEREERERERKFWVWGIEREGGERERGEREGREREGREREREGEKILSVRQREREREREREGREREKVWVWGTEIEWVSEFENLRESVSLTV